MSLILILTACVVQSLGQGYGGGGHGYGGYGTGADNRNRGKYDHNYKQGGYSYSEYGGPGREYGGTFGGSIGGGQILFNGDLGGYIPARGGSGGISATFGGAGGSYTGIQGYGVRTPSNIGGGYGFSAFNDKDGGQFNRGIDSEHIVYNGGIGGGGRQTTFTGSYSRSIGEVHRVPVAGSYASSLNGGQVDSIGGGYGGPIGDVQINHDITGRKSSTSGGYGTGQGRR